MFSRALWGLPLLLIFPVMMGSVNPIISGGGSGNATFGTPPAGYALAVSNATFNGYVLLVGTNGLIIGNGGGITNASGTFPGFYTIIPHDNGTNFILDFTNGFNAKIALTNDFVMLYHTNGPGDFKIKMRPGGANRNIWIPTNWVTASTNIVPYLDGATGKYWVYTLTNAANGMGPRVGMLVGSADGIYDTNMVYRFFETP